MEKSIKDDVIKIAKEIHQRIRKHGACATVSEHTKAAQQITSEWQNTCIEKLGNGNRFCKEQMVDDCSGERIDLLDTKEKIAYEMKVSGNNAHHEFYKDVMKVIMYNENHKEGEIRKLVWMSTRNGRILSI